MYRVKTFYAFLTVILLLALVVPLTVTAQPPRVAVCHLDDEGNYVPIEIADPALDAHIAHGDGLVGVDLDENCEPLIPDADGDGVADDVDNCLNTPNPDQSDRYGSAKGDACEDDSNGNGVLDVNEPHICVSIDGALIIQNGNAYCYTTYTTGQEPNIAVAHDDASAQANSGDNNTAIATDVGAEAFAQDGNNNTAMATGDYAYASAHNGNNNTAIATGNFAEAYARDGDNNTAMATGSLTEAVAQALTGCTAEAIFFSTSDVCP